MSLLTNSDIDRLVSAVQKAIMGEMLALDHWARQGAARAWRAQLVSEGVGMFPRYEVELLDHIARLQVSGFGLSLAEATVRALAQYDGEIQRRNNPPCAYCGTTAHLTESPAGDRCRDRQSRAGGANAEKPAAASGC